MAQKKIKNTSKKEENKKLVEENKKIEDEKYEKKLNNQTKIILLIIGVLIISIFLGVWISSESQKFDYAGQTFQKEMFGQIPIYTTQMQGYKFNGIPMNFKLVLRNNPAKSNVSVNGDLTLITNNELYFSLNMSSNLDKCGDSYALVAFGQFASNTGLSIKTGVSSKELALQYKKPFADCTSSTKNTVIILTNSNETGIYQDSKYKNCYIVKVNNCETIDALERLEMAIVAMKNNRPL